MCPLLADNLLGNDPLGLTISGRSPYRALVIHRITLYQPDPKRPGKDRKWRTVERDCKSLPEALSFIYRQLERTNPELVERISSIEITAVRGAQVPIT